MAFSIGSIDSLQSSMLHNILRAERRSDQAALRLATGKRINTAADDPAGFGFVTRQNARLTSLGQAKRNVEKVQSLSSTAQSGMDQIEENILAIRTSVQEALGGGLSESELATKQLEIDDALDAIDSLVASTKFGGRQLLQGSSLTSTSSTVSGLNPSQVKSIDLMETDPSQPTQNIDVNVDSIESAAELNYRGKSGQRVRDNADFTLTGDLGSANFQVSKNDSLQDLLDEINGLAGTTGVIASLSGNNLTFSSSESGSSATVEVDVTSGKFNVTGGDGSGFATGLDTVATINGQSVVATGSDTFEYRSADLDFDLVLESGFGPGPIDSMTVNNTTIESEVSTFTFQVGPDIGNTATLSIASLDSSELGGSLGSLADLRTGGSKSILGANAEDALSIADDAHSMLVTEQTRLGSFVNTTLQSTMNALTSQEISLTEAISIVESADMVEELAIQTKNDVLAEQSLNSLMQALTDFSSVSEVLGLLASPSQSPAPYAFAS